MRTVGGYCVSVCQLTLAHWEPGTLHLTSQGIHIVRAPPHTNTHMSRLLLPLPLLHGFAGFPASHTLPGKPESLCLIRVIETGPPGTKELLNCYPLAHLKDHLIKTFCVWFYSLSFPALPFFFSSYFSFIPFFLSSFLSGLSNSETSVCC